MNTTRTLSAAASRGAPASRRLAVSIALAAAATAAAAQPAEPIAPDRNESGLIVEVEYQIQTARDLGFDYAFVNETGTVVSGGGTVQTLEFDAKGVPRLTLGWRFGGEAAPVIRATLWESEPKGSAATGEKPGRVGALLASPDFAIGRSLVDEASARTALRATAVDVEVAWSLTSGSRGVVELAAGLRAFRLEVESGVFYGVEQFGIGFTEIIAETSDARGIGPRGAVGYQHRFGGRVRIGGEIGLAFLLGDIEATTTDSAFIDDSLDRFTIVERRPEDRTFRQIDLALEVEVALAPRWSVAAVWRFSEWDGVVSAQRFLDDVSQNSTVARQRSAVFEGGALAVSFAF